jgi:Leucine-rich repeat (LRR) protein
LLNSFSHQHFIGLENIAVLHLDENLIETLDEEPFSELINLKVINLSNNDLTILERETFQKNLNLEKIVLSSNNIFKVHPKSFDGLRKVKQIDLTKNMCVDEVIEDLNLINEKLEFCFRNYPNVVFCNYAEKDHDYICLLDNVALSDNKDAYFFGNHLPGQTDSDVVRVLFESSKLSAIPGQLFITFRNLQELNVDKTGLASINLLRNCLKLQSFKASHNNIEHLQPGTFDECSNLRIINLKSNKIKKLPAAVFEMNLKLEQIDLSYNQIAGIAHCEFFEGLKDLIFVDLKGNKCIDFKLQIKDTGVQENHKKLSLCHSSWIINQIMSD